jgi:hypothetical protein
VPAAAVREVVRPRAEPGGVEPSQVDPNTGVTEAGALRVGVTAGPVGASGAGRDGVLSGVDDAGGEVMTMPPARGMSSTVMTYDLLAAMRPPSPMNMQRKYTKNDRFVEINAPYRRLPYCAA